MITQFIIVTATYFAACYGQQVHVVGNQIRFDFHVLPDGRLISLNHTTGLHSTVCSNNWDDTDAQLVCKSLGLSQTGRAITLPRDSSYHREIYSIDCSGSENEIYDCPVDTYDSSHGLCDYMPDAAVDCTDQGVLSIQPDGRVVKVKNGISETICSNDWDDTDATVLCRQLGLGIDGKATYLTRDWSYPRADVYGFYCHGNESNMFDCNVNKIDTTNGMCATMQDSGAECGGQVPTLIGHPNGFDIHLMHDGRVAAVNLSTGLLTTVCSHNWDDADAEVVCRSLGMASSGSAKTVPRDWNFHREIYSIHCSGTEPNIADCPVDTFDSTHGMCDTMGDAAVDCHDRGTLHVNFDGRVIHVENGTEETICSYDWDDTDASVLCRYLGLGQNGKATYLQRDWSYPRANVYGVYCMGNETNAFDCHTNENDTTNGMCLTLGDAGVHCEDKGTLHVGPDGRLFHEENGTFETICSYDWDDTDASVMCRYLGLGKGGKATYLQRDWSYPRANVYGVYCMGNETNAFDCHTNENDTTNGMCLTLGDAGVECDDRGTLHVNPDGRVIHEENGTMETICSFDWDDTDASVVCRHLGLGMHGKATFLQRDWSYPRANVYGVYCIGNETDAFDCHTNENDTTHGMCDTMQDAGVDCGQANSTVMGHPTGYDIHLLPDGRVAAVNISTGHLTTVCSNNWADTDAGVLCRSLGLSSSGTAKTLPRDWNFHREIYGVHCVGSEPNIMDCPLETYDSTHGMCYQMEDAAVDCHANTVPTGHHNGFDIHPLPDGRLVSLNISTGLLKTVCSNNWDDVDAQVVCRSMGMSKGSAKTLPRDPTFSRGIYSIYCTGSEPNIADCPVKTQDSTPAVCDTMADAAIECSGGGTLHVNPDGRVIHEENGTMETICSFDWDDTDASVVCRHLGLGMHGKATYLQRDWSYPRANVYGVYCIGNETDAFDCHTNDNDTTHGMCDTMQDAGVDCGQANSTVMGYPTGYDIHLLPDGRVAAVNISTGHLTTVCSNNWADTDAGVLCRSLGLSSSGTAKTLPRDWNFHREIYGVHCVGIEPNIMDCPLETYDSTHGMCYQMEDAAVDCHANTVPTGHHNGFDIHPLPDGRLVAVNISTGLLTTVCSNNWDDVDAQVVCRSMGMSKGSAKTLPRDPVFSRGIYSIYCTGSEPNIADCPVKTQDSTPAVCDTMADAAIECGDKGTLHVNSDGRVIHEENGTMETICSYGWDDTDASVICRHLGLGMNGKATYLQRDWSYPRANVYGVYCIGNETDAFDCHTNENDTTNGMCATMQDAGVECGQGNASLPWHSNGYDIHLLPDGRVVAVNLSTGLLTTVCSHSWDDTDAGVVCKSLGMSPSGNAKTLPRDWNFNREIYSVHCGGTEPNIKDCPVETYDSTHGMCDTMGDAAVDCHANTMPMGNHNGFDIHPLPDGRLVALNISTGVLTTVCSNNWDDADAEVICRSMGMSKGSAKKVPRDWNFHREIYSIHCSGSEAHITDCSIETYDHTHGMCYTMDDAAIECGNEGTLHVGPDGRVFHEENGTFETICSYDWDDTDASVLCRHLGLGKDGKATYLQRDWSYPRANVYGVYCMGNETNAFDCHTNENDTTNGMCLTLGDAGVKCNEEKGTLHVGPDGRVFHEENGTFETICSYDWDDTDASVLCRHLGLGKDGKATYLQRDWSYARANVYGVYCMGNETNAFDCHTNENDTTNGMCLALGDAGVECNEEKGTLHVGPDGRVFHEENGTFETICSYDWDDTDASVLCRHLGLGKDGKATYLQRDWSYPRANVYGVYCMGNETNAFDCHTNENDTTNGMCLTLGDAGVECNEEKGTLHVGPDGRVFHEENGTFETICSYDWDDTDASVLCRHLGLGKDGKATYLQRDWSYPRANVYGVYCMGNETNAFDCHTNENDTTNGMCLTLGDAGVECNEEKGTLHVGPDGRVFHEENGTFETICSYDWDDTDASVLCRHLGLGKDGKATYLQRDWSYPRANVYGVYCMGNETNAFDCHTNENDTTNGMCLTLGDAGVECNEEKGTLHVGPDGRVFHEENGTFETICSYDWDDTDASVLCRHLGLGKDGKATYLQRDWSYPRANVYGVYCMGNETNAFDCHTNENDTTNGMCLTLGDAGVECNEEKGTLHVGPDGRVFHEENGTFETICSYDWDDTDASVLCRHLGLGKDGKATYLQRDWSYPRANVYGVYCMGNETNAFDCHTNENDTTNGMCLTLGDAGVECNEDKGTLHVGKDGRVFHEENGTFETICSYDWDDTDASVLCRHLGLGKDGKATYLQRDWSYPRANVYGVYCMGNETNAFDCHTNENDTTNGMCLTLGDAGVECNEDKGTLHVGHDGRVFHEENGTFETICSYDWDDTDASVLCRHLGLGKDGKATYLQRDWLYPRANVYGVYCMGNETNAFDCHTNENDTTNGMCLTLGDAGVECNEDRGTLHVATDGRVFHEENGTFETICSNDWDDTDATVMCRHLGLGQDGKATYLQRDWSYPRANVYGVYCMGNETNAFDCHTNENDTTNGMCATMEDAGVECYNQSTQTRSVYTTTPSISLYMSSQVQISSSNLVVNSYQATHFSGQNTQMPSSSMMQSSAWQMGTPMPLLPSSSQSFTTTVVNNLQPSASQIWPANPPASSSYVASSAPMQVTQVWSMNTHVPLQPSSSQGMTNMQTSIQSSVGYYTHGSSTQQMNTHMPPQSTSGYLVPGSSTQPMNTQMPPLSSSGYLLPTQQLNTHMPPLSSSGYLVPGSSTQQMNTQIPPLSSSGYLVPGSSTQPMNTQMPPLSSSGYLVPGSSSQPMNTQMAPQSSSGYLVTGSSTQPMNTQMPQQSSSGYLVHGSSTQPMNTQMQPQSSSGYLVPGSSTQPMNTQMPPQSSSGYLVPGSTTQPMNTQMPQQYSSGYLVHISSTQPTNTHMPPLSSSGYLVPGSSTQQMNTQMPPLSSSGYLVPGSSTQPMNTQMPPPFSSGYLVPGSSTQPMNTQMPQQSSSGYLVPGSSTQPMNTQMPPQSSSVYLVPGSSSHTMNTQMPPLSSSGYLVPGSSTQPMNTQMPPLFSSGYLVPGSSTQPINTPMPPQSSSGYLVPGSSTQPMNTQIPPQSSSNYLVPTQQINTHMPPLSSSGYLVPGSSTQPMNTQMPPQSSSIYLVPGSSTQPMNTQMQPQSSSGYHVPGSSTQPMNTQISQYLGTSTSVNNVQSYASQIWPANPPQSSSGYLVPGSSTQLMNTQMPQQSSSGYLVPGSSTPPMNTQLSQYLGTSTSVNNVQSYASQIWPSNPPQSSSGYLVPGSSTQPMNTQMPPMSSSGYLVPGSSTPMNTQMQPQSSSNYIVPTQQMNTQMPPLSSSGHLVPGSSTQPMNTQISPLSSSGYLVPGSSTQPMNTQMLQQSSSGYLVPGSSTQPMNTQIQPMSSSGYLVPGSSTQTMNTQMQPMSSTGYLVPGSSTQTMNTQMPPQSSSGYLVPGSSTQLMNTQISQYLGTSTAVNNVQSSASQIWPANPPQSSTSFPVPGSSTQPMTTQMPPQSLSSYLVPTQQIYTQMQPLSSSGYLVLGSSTQPMNTQIAPQSSSSYFVPTQQMNTHMPPLSSSGYLVPVSSTQPMNTQMPQQSSSGYLVPGSSTQPMNTQMPQQSSSGYLVPGSSTQPMNTQMQSLSSSGYLVPGSSTQPMNTQMPPQSSSGYLVPASSTQPMNTQISQYLGTSTAVNNVQSSASQIWPANPPQSSSGVPVPGSSTQPMNTQMPPQSSSGYLAPTQQMNTQLLPQSSTSFHVPGSSTQPMNTHIPPQSSSSYLVPTQQIFTQMTPLSSSGYLVPGSSTQPMNTQIALQSSSSYLVPTQQMNTQIPPLSSSGYLIPGSSTQPMITQMPPQSSSGNLVPGSSTQPMNTQMPSPSSSGYLIPGSSTQAMNTQMAPQSSSGYVVLGSSTQPMNTQMPSQSSSGYIVPGSSTQQINTQMQPHFSSSFLAPSQQMNTQMPPHSSSSFIAPTQPMNTQMPSQSSSGYLVPGSSMQPMNTQMPSQSSSGYVVPGSSSQPMNTQMPSLSSSGYIVPGSSTQPMNTQLPPHSSSSFLAPTQQMNTQMTSQYSTGYLVPGSSTQPMNTQVPPQSSTTYLAAGSSTQPMNTQMPPQSSSSYLVPGSSTQQMNTQMPPQSSTSYFVPGSSTQPMNTQMPPQSSSGYLVPGSSTQQMNTQMPPQSSTSYFVPGSSTQPLNTQMPPQSSTGYLAPGSSTQPMNTQISQYLGTSTAVNNVQSSASQIWPANPPPSSYFASSVNLQTTQAMNTQMPIQPSSSQTMTNTLVPSSTYSVSLSTTSQLSPQSSTSAGVNAIQSSAYSSTMVQQQVTSSPVHTSVHQTPVASVTPAVAMTTSQQLTTQHQAVSSSVTPHLASTSPVVSTTVQHMSTPYLSSTQQITTQSGAATSSINPTSSSSANAQPSGSLSANLGSGGKSVWSYCSWKILVLSTLLAMTTINISFTSV